MTLPRALAGNPQGNLEIWVNDDEQISLGKDSQSTPIWIDWDLSSLTRKGKSETSPSKLCDEELFEQNQKFFASRESSAATWAEYKLLDPRKPWGDWTKASSKTENQRCLELIRYVEEILAGEIYERCDFKDKTGKTITAAQRDARVQKMRKNILAFRAAENDRDRGGAAPHISLNNPQEQREQNQEAANDPKVTTTGTRKRLTADDIPTPPRKRPRTYPEQRRVEQAQLDKDKKRRMALIRRIANKGIRIDTGILEFVASYEF